MQPWPGNRAIGGSGLRREVGLGLGTGVAPTDVGADGGVVLAVGVVVDGMRVLSLPSRPLVIAWIHHISGSSLVVK